MCVTVPQYDHTKFPPNWVVSLQYLVVFMHTRGIILRRGHLIEATDLTAENLIRYPVDVVTGPVDEANIRSSLGFTTTTKGAVIYTTGDYRTLSFWDGVPRFGLLTVVGDKIGWSLWDCSRNDGYYEIGPFTGEFYLFDKVPRRLDSDILRPKFRDRRGLSWSYEDDQRVIDKINRSMSGIEVRQKAMSRRTASKLISVAAAGLLTGSVPRPGVSTEPRVEVASENTPAKGVIGKPEGDGNQQPITVDKSLPEPDPGDDHGSEPSDEEVVIPDHQEWDYFNGLKLTEAREYVQEVGPEIAFEVGSSARLIIADEEGKVLSEVSNPLGVLSDGFFLLDEDVEPDIFESLNAWAGQMDVAEESLWVEFDASSLIPYAGSECIGEHSPYRIFLKLGDYDGEENRLEDSEEDKEIRRIEGVVGISGRVMFVSRPSLNLVSNQVRGIRAIHSRRDLISDGEVTDCNELLALVPEDIAKYYTDRGANGLGGYFDVDAVDSEVKAANVCDVSRMIYKAISSFGYRSWAYGVQVPQIIERYTHGYDPRYPFASKPPFDVLYFDEGEVKIHRIQSRIGGEGSDVSPRDLHDFMLAHPSSLILPFDDRSWLGESSEIRGVTDVRDYMAFPTDAMVGPNSKFRALLPPGTSLRAMTRVVPLNYGRTVGSTLGDSDVVIIINQVSLGTADFDPITQLEIELENSEAVDTLDHRSESYISEYKKVAEARDYIRGVIERGGIDSEEELRNRIRDIVTCPGYFDVVEKYFVNADIELAESGGSKSRRENLNMIGKLIHKCSGTPELVEHFVRELCRHFDPSFFQFYSLADLAFDVDFTSAAEQYESSGGTNDELRRKTAYLVMLALFHDLAFLISSPDKEDIAPEFRNRSICKFLSYAEDVADLVRDYYFMYIQERAD